MCISSQDIGNIHLNIDLHQKWYSCQHSTADPVGDKTFWKLQEDKEILWTLRKKYSLIKDWNLTLRWLAYKTFHMIQTNLK